MLRSLRRSPVDPTPDRIEAALKRDLPGSRIVIHIEPEEKAKHG